WEFCAMSPIKVFAPRVKVVLHKTIMREVVADGALVSTRFRGSTKDAAIDLTPFLGEVGAVRTSKSIRDAAGGFQVVLSDKLYEGDSLAGLIEPMDVVTIAMSHDAVPGEPQATMRGFVTSVRRTEGVDGNGRPQRVVVISGHDYGKLLTMLQVKFTTAYSIGADFMSTFRIAELFGDGVKTAMPINDYIATLIRKMADPYLKALLPPNSLLPSEIKLDLSVKQGVTVPQGSQNQEGTIHQLMTYFGDVPLFNELFLEDRADGVFLVFRPSPLKTTDGKMIQPEAPEVDVIDLPGGDVVELDLERNDQNVVNHLWLRAPRYEMQTEYWRRLNAIAKNDPTVVLGPRKGADGKVDSTYANSDPSLYGNRYLEAETQLGANDQKNDDSGQSEKEQGARDLQIAEWCNDRRKILALINKDNAVLESGTMRIRGRTDIRAGTYVRLVRGGFSAAYYVTGVSHNYLPFSSFTSTLTVERGLGFVERSKRDGGRDSPYLSELRGLR
ncbi:MAG: hypothetical protein C5B56_05265, partial [Proteobacteria bacterium]